MSLFFGRGETRTMPTWSEFTDAAGTSAWGSAGATGLVPYFSAIRHITGFMSTLPVDGYRLDGDNRRETALPALLRRLDEPGDIGVGNWIGQWAYGQAVDGNSVGWITAVDGFGYPIGVRWLSRADWSYDEDTHQWYIFGHAAPSSRVVHSPWIVPAGKTLGISTLEHFRAFWRAGMSAQEYADVSRGGGFPPAILKNDMRTIEDPAIAAKIQARAVTSFASGKPFVTGKDWTLTASAIPPNQAKFLETLQLVANDVAAIFGIDAREIGGTGGAGSVTYTNDESKSLNRANDLRPYLVRFESMISRLMPPRQYVKLNVDATIRTDIKTRTEVVGAKLKDGRMSVNEARALDDQEPVPGGDFYNIPRPATEPVNREGDPS